MHPSPAARKPEAPFPTPGRPPWSHCHPSGRSARAIPDPAVILGPATAPHRARRPPPRPPRTPPRLLARSHPAPRPAGCSRPGLFVTGRRKTLLLPSHRPRDRPRSAPRPRRCRPAAPRRASSLPRSPTGPLPESPGPPRRIVHRHRDPPGSRRPTARCSVAEATIHPGLALPEPEPQTDSRSTGKGERRPRSRPHRDGNRSR